MSVSHLRFAKSETRDLADRDRADPPWRFGDQPTEWRMSNATFFTAFCVIAAALTVLALVLR